VLSDAANFTNSRESLYAHVAAAADEETAARLLPLGGPSLLSYDPPDHTRLRGLVAPRFTVKRMFGLRSRVEAIVTEHLDAMAAAGGPIDLVQAFALPVPSLVICELLGVAYDDRADFQCRSNALLDLELDLDERQKAFEESNAYMAELVRRQRARPGDNLLGTLVREHGDELPDEELVSLGSLLLVTGHEITANMLGLGTLLLLRHPDQLALLRDDPGIVERTVEELMRYLSIVHTGIVRTALTASPSAARPSRPATRWCAPCRPPTATRRSSKTRTCST
jgi:cytochrome P450